MIPFLCLVDNNRVLAGMKERRNRTSVVRGGFLAATALALCILRYIGELRWAVDHRRPSTGDIAAPSNQHTISSTHALPKEEEAGTIECDVSRYRYNICYINGPVRIDPTTGTVLLLFSPAAADTTTNTDAGSSQASLPLKLRPHPRKWENQIMRKIKELTITTVATAGSHCDFYHDETALVFSTGGYTGNIFHDLNDGILPLFLTSRTVNQSTTGLALIVSEYHDWWARKYRELLMSLSLHPPIDLDKTISSHCFRRGAIVGLVSHGELTIDPSRMPGRDNMRSFRAFLDEAYSKKSKDGGVPRKHSHLRRRRSPVLAMVVREKSRCIVNQAEVTALAERIGFAVKVFRPTRYTALREAFGLMNGSHAMMGVHGAGLTHLLFLRPGAVFVQVVPLGTQWAAETCYGRPAREMGLEYLPYRIEVKESSLVDLYDRNDTVLRDPDSVVKRGWMNTKNIYLGPQNVTLDLERLRPHLETAYRKARRFMEDSEQKSKPV